MSKSSIVILAILVIIVVLGAIFFVSMQSGAPSNTLTQPVDQGQNTNAPVTPAPAVSTPSAPAAAEASVSISNFKFLPAALTVSKGTTVTWTNNDTAPHTVTGNNGGPASQTLTPGQTYRYTFNTTGTFNYHCSIHPMMTATVVVK